MMDHVGITEIPKKHIVTRWTREVRYVLPKNLTLEQKILYAETINKLVKMGAASEEAYDMIMGSLNKLMASMAQYREARGGLGLEERPTAERLLVDERPGDCSVDDSDTVSATPDPLVGLPAPCKKPKPGMPTSWEKAPYELMRKATRLCSICRLQGHKKMTCPERGDLPKQPRKQGRCTNCGVAGHRGNTCSEPPGFKISGGKQHK